MQDTAFFLVFLVACWTTVRCDENATYVDIHVPVAGPALESVMRANEKLTALLAPEYTNDIDFRANDTAHITLYLTSFSCPTVGNVLYVSDCVDLVAKATEDAISALERRETCNINVRNVYAIGAYAFLNVSLSDCPCLQTFSDKIVNYTYTLSEPNQTAPSWINNLPEPERSEKLRDVARYGSPNVFSEFQPHITIGWCSDTQLLNAAIRKLGVEPTSFYAETIALGSVGPHGTVLKGRDYARFSL